LLVLISLVASVLSSKKLMGKFTTNSWIDEQTPGIERLNIEIKTKYSSNEYFYYVYTSSIKGSSLRLLGSFIVGAFEKTYTFTRDNLNDFFYFWRGISYWSKSFSRWQPYRMVSTSYA
jgi:hypothetical protein